MSAAERKGSEKRIRTAIVGAGSWGTALARLLHGNGHEVRLWSYEKKVAEAIRRTRENTTYLPGVHLEPEIGVSHRLEDVVPGASLVVSVSPSQYVGSIMSEAAVFLDPEATVVSASKGIEVDSLRRMDEVLAPFLTERQKQRLVALSGPSFAAEVARDGPTAVVAAGPSKEARLEVQRVFRSSTFRVYTSPDLIGVELGGALKNVIALAAGVIDGLDFGYNARAALITRGLAEMARLGTAMGARTATFYGLAGMGDLVLTCTSELSRNHTVGTRLGRGETLEEILAEMNAVAEGVRTTPAVHALARHAGVEVPITEQVHAILAEGKPARDAVHELMLREPTSEWWGPLSDDDAQEVE